MWRTIGIILLIIVALLGVVRLLRPSELRRYVNRTRDRNQIYEGRIGDVQVHLLRGAYSIHDVKISQRTGNVPVPLLAAKVVDFSIQWNALRSPSVLESRIKELNLELGQPLPQQIVRLTEPELLRGGSMGGKTGEESRSLEETATVP